MRNGLRATTTTAGTAMSSGLDVAGEGNAQRVHDPAALQRLAGAYASKCGWKVTVDGRMFRNEQGDEALMFAVAPVKAFGCGREGRYTATLRRLG